MSNPLFRAFSRLLPAGLGAGRAGGIRCEHSLYRLGIEAGVVILHNDPELAGLVGQQHINIVRGCMLEHVRERLPDTVAIQVTGGMCN
jgi:hypothetical protein